MNNKNIYYFYSDFSELSLKYLYLAKELDIFCINIDSKQLRKKINFIDRVPSVVEKFENNLNIYQGVDAEICLKFQRSIEIVKNKQNLKEKNRPGRTLLKFPIKNEELENTVKKSVKEYTIMDKVKLLTKERELING